MFCRSNANQIQVGHGISKTIIPVPVVGDATCGSARNPYGLRLAQPTTQGPPVGLVSG
jgi:hypothetical protein